MDFFGPKLNLCYVIDKSGSDWLVCFSVVSAIESSGGVNSSEENVIRRR